MGGRTRRGAEGQRGTGQEGTGVQPSSGAGAYGAEERVASEEARREARVELLAHKEAEQLLGKRRVARLGRGLDGLVPHLVLLRERDRLRPLLGALVEHGADAAELQQTVLLALLRHLNRIEVRVLDHRLRESLVVLLLHVQFV